MNPKRPINADVPGPVAAEEPEPKRPAPAPPSPPRTQRVPGAIKLVAALVFVALGFLALAVLGGRGGEDEATTAPVLASPSGDSEGGAVASASELGFPVFATGNTTRVGGSDATVNAAAVALAVFPSTTPEQRPAAVTLVAADDWAGGIASAVLMAAAVRAPVLVSSADGMPAATESALAALSPQGSEATDDSAIVAIGNVAIPGSAPTARVAAGSAAREAAAIARLRDRLFGAPPAHIVIASSTQPQFAMPAAGWAARSGDPVLYAGARLPKPTAAYLRQHPRTPIFVLGPSTAISSDVVREIDKAGGEVRRVAGETPVANAIALARYRNGSFGWNVNDPGHGFVLARPDETLDAAAAAPLSASGTWGPLLLTDSADTLPAELRSYFLDVKPGYTDNPTRAFYNHVWVIGDQEAIDVNQQAEANELAELARIGGER